MSGATRLFGLGRSRDSPSRTESAHRPRLKTGATQERVTSGAFVSKAPLALTLSWYNSDLGESDSVSRSLGDTSFGLRACCFRPPHVDLARVSLVELALSVPHPGSAPPLSLSPDLAPLLGDAPSTSRERPDPRTTPQAAASLLHPALTATPAPSRSFALR